MFDTHFFDVFDTAATHPTFGSVCAVGVANVCTGDRVANHRLAHLGWVW